MYIQNKPSASLHALYRPQCLECPLAYEATDASQLLQYSNCVYETLWGTESF
jgi:hypothetical protein